MAKIRALVLDHRIRSGGTVPIGHARLQRLLIYVSQAGTHQVTIAQRYRFVSLREEVLGGVAQRFGRRAPYHLLYLPAVPAQTHITHGVSPSSVPPSTTST